MNKITPEMVKISIGLRTPELYEDTKDEILNIPLTFKKILVDYFNGLVKKRKLDYSNIEQLAIMFLSLNFGFIFLKASFGKNLLSWINLNDSTYVLLFYIIYVSIYLC